MPSFLRAAAWALACALLFVMPAAAQTARVNADCTGVALPLRDATNLFVDQNGRLCITIGGSPGVITGSQEQDVRGTGTLTASSTASAITIPVNGQGTVGLTFTGLTASGATVSFFQSNDGGTTYTGVSEVNTGTGVTSLTRSADGQVRISVSGRTNLKIQVSTAGTGTVTVAWNVSVREGLVSLASPIPPGANTIGGVTPAGITRTRLTCTLPAYAAGGNIVCTDQAGAQTTTACSANTACLVAAANPLRKTTFAMNRTPGVSVDLGYAASVAPGLGIGLDGPAAANGQGGSIEENPAHVGPYYAAAASAATLVFVQGQ